MIRLGIAARRVLADVARAMQEKGPWDAPISRYVHPAKGGPPGVTHIGTETPPTVGVRRLAAPDMGERKSEGPKPSRQGAADLGRESGRGGTGDGAASRFVNATERKR